MEYEEMRQIVATQVCAQCGGELTIKTNPGTGRLEIWCPHNPDHGGYTERETYTQEMRRGVEVHPAIRAHIEKRMLPGGYEVGTALAIVKTRFPRADLDDPSAALFIVDCMRLDLDPLLGEIVPVTFKVTDKETQEVRRVVQPILTEDGWLSLCSRACPDRWVGPPWTYRLEDYLRTLEENKGKSPEEIQALAKGIKKDACDDEEAYYWMAWGKVKVNTEIIETAPSPGWLKQKEYKKAQEARTPAGELPGNQARVRAIKRWVRENFPEAKAKMKDMTSEWLQRGKDIDQVQQIIAAEYHIVTEAEPLKGGGKIGEPAQDKAGSRTIPQEAAGAETIKKQGAGEAGETILPPTKTPKPKKIAEPPARDPSTIKNFGELFQALWDDYHITKTETLNELNVHSQEEITELPSECYRRIATVRA